MLGIRKGWSLKRVRRTLAQGWIGKGVALMLGAAMIAPSVAMPAAVANATPERWGGGK
ncbi:MAG: hypothetical protein WHS44_08895 [Fimbriimonadales bacterium]